MDLKKKYAAKINLAQGDEKQLLEFMRAEETKQQESRLKLESELAKQKVKDFYNECCLQKSTQIDVAYLVKILRFIK
jgi:hypothetical protein